MFGDSLFHVQREYCAEFTLQGLFMKDNFLPLHRLREQVHSQSKLVGLSRHISVHICMVGIGRYENYGQGIYHVARVLKGL